MLNVSYSFFIHTVTSLLEGRSVTALWRALLFLAILRVRVRLQYVTASRLLNKSTSVKLIVVAPIVMWSTTRLTY